MTDEEAIEDLSVALRQEKCVLFIGPDVALVTDPEFDPSLGFDEFIQSKSGNGSLSPLSTEIVSKMSAIIATFDRTKSSDIKDVEELLSRLAQVKLDSRDINEQELIDSLISYLHGRSEIPISYLVSRKLHSRLNDPSQIGREAPLPSIAQAYLYDDRDTRGTNKLFNVTAKTYASFENQTTGLHRKIGQLPFIHCVSTSLDSFLENGLVESGKEPRSVLFDYSKREKDVRFRLPPSTLRPNIYKLSGSLTDPSSVVISEDHLIAYLIHIVKFGFPSRLSEIISEPSAVFLFLGFGLHNWHLRILLRILDETSNRENPSFALEHTGGSNSIPPHSDAQVFYKHGHKILFLESKPETIVDRIIEELTSEPYKRNDCNHTQREAPQVFLSHARLDANRDDEQADVIDTIQQWLESNGYRVWRDRTKIRGGDQWEREIEAAIQNSSYFLFVQSRHTEDPVTSRMNPIENYWRRELELALNRSAKFAKTIRFMIPVKIESCEPVADLRPFHEISLHVEGGYDDLILTLDEDQQIRKRDPIV